MNIGLDSQHTHKTQPIQHSHLNPPSQFRLVYCLVEEPDSSTQHHLPDLLKKNCRKHQLGLFLRLHQRQDQEGYLALFHRHLPLLQFQDSQDFPLFLTFRDFPIRLYQ